MPEKRKIDGENTESSKKYVTDNNPYVSGSGLSRIPRVEVDIDEIPVLKESGGSAGVVSAKWKEIPVVYKYPRSSDYNECIDTEIECYERILERLGGASSSRRHPNIVNIYGCCPPTRKNSSKEGHALVMEAYEGSLQRAISKKRLDDVLPTAEGTIRFLADMADALLTVHASGFVHCDVRPANILFTYGAKSVGESERRFVLADFGHAMRPNVPFDKEYRNQRASITHLSPDWTSSFAVDVYGLGACALNVLYGMSLSYTNETNAILYMRTHTKPKPRRAFEDFPEAVQTLKELAEDCMLRTQSRRPSMAEVKRRLEAMLREVPNNHPRSTELGCA